MRRGSQAAMGAEKTSYYGNQDSQAGSEWGKKIVFRGAARLKIEQWHEVSQSGASTRALASVGLYTENNWGCCLMHAVWKCVLVFRVQILCNDILLVFQIIHVKSVIAHLFSFTIKNVKFFKKDKMPYF